MNLKKTIAALSIAALTICPAVTQFSTPMTANAASFVTYHNGSNKDVKFDVDQIVTTIDTFKNGPISISKKLNNPKTQITGTASKVLPLDRQTITVTLNVLQTNVDSMKEKTRLTVVNKIDGCTATHGNIKPVSCVQSGKSRGNHNEYTLTFDIVTHGDSYDYTISGFGKADSLTSVSAKSTANNYYKVTVDTPGDDLYISMPKAGLTSSQINTWARNHAILANSLKDLTGSSTKTLFVLFDAKGSHYAWSASYGWENTKTKTNDKYSIINLGNGTIDDPGATEKEISLIKENSNAFNYATIHEMGHAYNYMSGNKFQSLFGYETNHDYSLRADENYTNVRALTAIENCINIRNYNIKEENRETKKVENCKYSDLHYMNHPVVTNYNFYSEKGMVSLGNWEALEQFYRADSADDFSSNRNKSAASALMRKTGFNISSTNIKYKEYLKYVNALRHLYILTWCGGSPSRYSDNNFIYFVDQTFTIPNDKQHGINKSVSGINFIRDMSIDYFG